MRDAREILGRKRDGHALSREEIDWFVSAHARREIPDYQASALLMAIFLVGMDEEELFHWTGAMIASGKRLELAHLDGPKVDKHSTGGVGDKVSIPLAPALASLGCIVPMISGRGLLHTGGTLDKMEAIPGLRTELTESEVVAVLEEAGAVMAAQTAELVPADKALYALRDATGLVASIPLIASSILSKKIAESLDALVLDVKYGSGAFLPDPREGEKLARAMLALASRFGLSASVYQTSMEEPIGRTAGHALEIAECIECLRGGGPEDLRELVLVLGAELLCASGRSADREAGRAAIEDALGSGAALDRFRRMVAAQGGDPRVVDEPARLPRAPGVELVRAAASAVLACRDCRALGLAVCALGGGRLRAGDAIDPTVGLVWLRRFGEEVGAGEPILEIHHRDGRGLAGARAWIERGIEFGAERPRPALILRRITA